MKFEMDVFQLSADVLNVIPNLLNLPFEKSFTSNDPVEFTKNNYWIAISCVTAYILFITLGSKYMKDKAPFDLKVPLAMWNAALSIFSFIGMCRTVS